MLPMSSATLTSSPFPMSLASIAARNALSSRRRIRLDTSARAASHVRRPTSLNQAGFSHAAAGDVDDGDVASSLKKERCAASGGGGGAGGGGGEAAAAPGAAGGAACLAAERRWAWRTRRR